MSDDIYGNGDPAPEEVIWNEQPYKASQADNVVIREWLNTGQIKKFNQQRTNYFAESILLQGFDAAGIDLTGVDFSGLDLTGVKNLELANGFQSINVNGANLTDQQEAHLSDEQKAARDVVRELTLGRNPLKDVAAGVTSDPERLAGSATRQH